jgi:outer membrane protein assembly factor BamB
MTLALALVVSVTVLDLPRSPLYGFGMRGDVIYLGKPVEGRVQVERLRRSGDVWKSEFTFPEKFKGPLGVIAVSDGVVIGDYEEGRIFRYKDSGKVVWKTWLRYPNRFTVGPNDTIWAFFSSGLVARKIPDSSEFEPFLARYGQELTMPRLSHLVARDDGGFYAVDLNGMVLSVTKTGVISVLATGLGAEAIALLKGEIYLLSVQGTPKLYRFRNGKAELIWTAPSAEEQVAEFFALPDRLAIAVGTRDKGRVFLIAPGA